MKTALEEKLCRSAACSEGKEGKGVRSLESSPLMVQRAEHAFPIDCVLFISVCPEPGEALSTK